MATKKTGKQGSTTKNTNSKKKTPVRKPVKKAATGLKTVKPVQNLRIEKSREQKFRQYFALALSLTILILALILFKPFTSSEQVGRLGDIQRLLNRAQEDEDLKFYKRALDKLDRALDAVDKIDKDLKKQRINDKI
ncbi:MAG: hypothetical protein KAS64_11480, partial [Spirochaetes bacterium]|nr:hypothetical protein [Spirochaetota bacterium]